MKDSWSIVYFITTAAAEATNALSGQQLSGRWLSIQYNKSKSTKAIPKNATRFERSVKDPGCIFVGNLSWIVDEDVTRTAFALGNVFGTIRLDALKDVEMRRCAGGNCLGTSHQDSATPLTRLS